MKELYLGELKVNRSVIGIELARARQRLNMTLDETAEGICSISYLCKVEKAKLLPTPEYLRAFCKVLKIDDQRLAKTYKMEEEIRNVLYYYFYADYQKIIKIYDEYKELDNNLVDLIRAVTYSITKRERESNEEFEKIAKYFTKEETNMYKIFLIFNAISDYKVNLIFRARKKLLYALSFCKNAIMDCLCNEFLFYIGVITNDIFTYDYYNAVQKCDLAMFVYPRYEYLQIAKTIYFIQNKKYNKAKSQLKFLKDSVYYNDLLYVYYLLQKDYESITNELMNVRFETEALNMSRFLHTMSGKNYVLEYSGPKIGDFRDFFSELIYYEFTKDKSDMSKYVRHLLDLFCIAEHSDFYLGKKIVGERLMKYYAGKQKYKKIMEIYRGVVY